MFHQLFHFLSTLPKVLDAFFKHITLPLAYIGFGITLSVLLLSLLIDFIQKAKEKKNSN